MIAGYAQSGWLVELVDGTQSSFEIVAPCPRPYRALLHIGHDHCLPFGAPEMWTPRDPICSSAFRGPFYGASCIVSRYGNLEVAVAQTDGTLAHFWRNSIYGWRGPTFLPGLASGPPAFIQSRFGSFGNFEIVVPRRGGGLSHFWRENDSTGAWYEAPQPYIGGSWSGVALIHNSDGDLELVGVMDADLVCMWQQGIGGMWVGPFRIAERFAGRPGLIEDSSFTGSIQLIAPKEDGGLARYCRETNYRHVWEYFGKVQGHLQAPKTTFDDVSMVHSSDGWLEVIAREVSSEDDRFVRLQHYRIAPRGAWNGPNNFLFGSAE